MRPGKPQPIFVVDTREPLQTAYSFPRYSTVRRKLEVGDYAVLGLERDLSVERKELKDFVHTVTVEHDRFEREIARAKADGTQLVVVVEATLEHVTDQRYPGVVDPRAVLGAIAWLNAECGVPVLFAGDRRMGREMTERILERAWEVTRRGAVEAVTISA